MKPFEAKQFNLPTLDGISEKTTTEHLGLYQGYVKNYNSMASEMVKLKGEENPHAISELLRRLSFEFDGMRLHEYYFAQFESGPSQLEPNSPLTKAIEEKYKSVENLTEMLKKMGSMRGPGWALIYWDKVSGQLLPGFSGEQHQGHFVTLPIILAIDVWEHAFILDHGAAGKGKYLDAFFKNLNWSVCEKNFSEAQK